MKSFRWFRCPAICFLLIFCLSATMKDILASSQKELPTTTSGVSSTDAALQQPTQLQQLLPLQQQEIKQKQEQELQQRQEIQQQQLQDGKYVWARVALKALRHLMEYLMEKADQVNLDGMIGIGVVEGQFSMFLKRNGTIPGDVKDEFQSLALFGREIIDRATPFLLSSQPAYFKQLGTALSKGFFDHDYDSRVTNSTLIYTKSMKVNHKFSEGKSDNCLSQLTGTGRYAGRSCTSISDDCFSMMTSIGFNRFSLTHQVLYFLFGESMNCNDEFATIGERFCHLRGSCYTVPQLQEIFCANIVKEMNSIDANDFPGNTEDLFMEQVLLCGILGFKDVCNVRWLEMMVSWQQPNSGCYVLNFNRHLPSHRRQKRYDVLIDDGCSAHKSSVAAGALAVCAKFFAEDPNLP